MVGMATALLVVICINLVLFSSLAVWAVRFGRREDQPRTRMLAFGLAGVAGAFVLGGVTRIVLVADEISWLDVSPAGFVTSTWHFAQSILATTLAVGGIVGLRRIGPPLRDAERIAGAIAERLPSPEEFDAYGLTPRELEVLDVLTSGRLTDREIAEDLYISPATAATHVRNILRKTQLSSRRDLALLASNRRS